MKIRNGFVSNSSSSSFICAICGDEFEGHEAVCEDFDLIAYDNDEPCDDDDQDYKDNKCGTVCSKHLDDMKNINVEIPLDAFINSYNYDMEMFYKNAVYEMVKDKIK